MKGRYADGHHGLLALPLLVTHKHDKESVEASSYPTRNGIHSLPDGTLRTGVKRHHYLTADVRMKKNKQLFRKPASQILTDKIDMNIKAISDSDTSPGFPTTNRANSRNTATSFREAEPVDVSYQRKHELAQVIIRNATTRWDILDQPQLNGTYVYCVFNDVSSYLYSAGIGISHIICHCN